MGFLIFVIVLAVIFTAVHFQAKRSDAAWLHFAKPGLGVLLALAIAFFSTHTIPAGNAGLVRQFGAIAGQTGDGLQFTWPWESVEKANVQTQGYKFDKLDSFSKETQNVFINATVNFHVSNRKVQQLYRTVGANYFNVLIAPRVNQYFKDETVKYASVDIAPNREAIRRHVRDRLTQELKASSIDVEDLLIDDISFSNQFESAIENKQAMTQQALQAQAGIAVAEAEAKQAIARERGVGEAALARAEKMAQANRELSASLTPLLVQQNAIDKLSPKVQVMMLPNNGSLLLNPSMIGGK